MTIQGILGIAEVMVIITAGDYTVGEVVAFINIVMSKMVSTGSNIASTILLVMMLSALIGLANGMMVYNLQKIPPFIATLGMMSVLRGATLLISNGSNIFGLPHNIADFLLPTLLAYLIFSGFLFCL